VRGVSISWATTIHGAGALWGVALVGHEMNLFKRLKKWIMQKRGWVIFRKARLMANPQLPEKLPKPTDDRRKQRNSKRESEAFLASLDSLYGELRAVHKNGKYFKSLCREMGQIDMIGSRQFLSLSNRIEDSPTLGTYSTKDFEFFGDIDVSSFAHCRDEDTSEWSDTFTLDRVRSVKPTSNRSLPYKEGRTFLEHRVIAFDPSLSRREKIYGNRFHLFSDDLTSWRIMFKDAHGRLRIEDFEDFALDQKESDRTIMQRCEELKMPSTSAMSLRGMAMSIMLKTRLECCWRMSFQRGSLKLYWDCDNTQCREILHLRDKFESRRPPAMHWCRQHWRTLSNGKRVWVPAHMRGNQEFQWGGWACNLLPSPFDRSASETGFLPISDVGDRQQWLKGGKSMDQLEQAKARAL
jgi:hypothetical protein